MHGGRTMIARQSSSPIGGEEFPKLCAAVLRYNYKFSLGELYDRLKLWWIDIRHAFFGADMTKYR